MVEIFVNSQVKAGLASRVSLVVLMNTAGYLQLIVLALHIGEHHPPDIGCKKINKIYFHIFRVIYTGF